MAAHLDLKLSSWRSLYICITDLSCFPRLTHSKLAARSGSGFRERTRPDWKRSKKGFLVILVFFLRKRNYSSSEFEVKAKLLTLEPDQSLCGQTKQRKASGKLEFWGAVIGQLLQKRFKEESPFERLSFAHSKQSLIQLKASFSLSTSIKTFPDAFDCFISVSRSNHLVEALWNEFSSSWLSAVLSAPLTALLGTYFYSRESLALLEV